MNRIAMMAVAVLAWAAPVDVPAAAGRGALVTLEGRTTHPVLRNASIEVSAGSASAVTGSTDPDGRFSIDFACTDPDGVVLIEVAGSGAQSQVGAARVVHSCAYLMAAADPSGTFATGVVSPLSTAVYAVLHWTLTDLGRPTSGLSLPDIAPNRHTLHLNEVGRVLDALLFVHNGDVELPPGPVNSLALALDRPLLLETASLVLEEVPFERYRAVNQALVFSPAVYRNPDPPASEQRQARYCPPLQSACPGFYTLLPSLPGEYALYSGGGEAQFTYRARQDRIQANRLENADSNLRAIRVEGADGTPLSSNFLAVVVDGVQVEAYDDRVWQDIRLADASELIELIGASSKIIRRFPNNPEIPERVFEPTGVAFSAGFSDRGQLPAWTAPQAGEAWLLPFRFEETIPERLAPFGVDRVVFDNDGTAQALRQNITLDWQIVDGRLILDGAAVDTHEYQLLGESLVPGGHQEAMVSVRGADGLLGATDSAVIRTSGPSAFVESEVPGRYVSGFDIDRVLPPPSFGQPPYPQEFFLFQLNAGGTGWRATMSDVQGPEPADASPVEWSLNARGEVVIHYEVGSGFEIWRSWTPAATTAENELYVLEVGPAFISDDPDYEVPYVPGRFNFYRRVAPPATGAAAEETSK
ncbi:MAG: hypothetical protein GVY11_04895 [Gammaproteobacteria bacterium]|jgi:hypothetical protein|nr:hypothetical protein [Gammaproteobacteria bacterium]